MVEHLPADVQNKLRSLSPVSSSVEDSMSAGAASAAQGTFHVPELPTDPNSSASVTLIAPSPDPNSYGSYSSSGSTSLTVPPLTIVEVLAVAFLAIALMHLVTRWVATTVSPSSVYACMYCSLKACPTLCHARPLSLDTCSLLVCFTWAVVWTGLAAKRCHPACRAWYRRTQAHAAAAAALAALGPAGGVLPPHLRRPDIERPSMPPHPAAGKLTVLVEQPNGMVSLICLIYMPMTLLHMLMIQLLTYVPLRSSHALWRRLRCREPVWLPVRQQAASSCRKESQWHQAAASTGDIERR